MPQLSLAAHPSSWSEINRTAQRQAQQEQQRANQGSESARYSTIELSADGQETSQFEGEGEATAQNHHTRRSMPQHPRTHIPEESARRIIDDWLVPVLVEKFIRSKETSSKSDERKA